MTAKIALPSIASLPPNATTRTRILTAGVEVLHSEGFAALTQHAVAEKAGVRQSHITYYFPTRLDLLQATAQFGCESMMAPISDAATAGKLNFAQFRELLLPDVTDRGWWRLMIALVTACSESENIRAWIIQFDEQIRARLRAGFRAFDVELSDLDVEFLHASYIGAITLDMQVLTDASQARAREIVGLAIDLLAARAVQAKSAKQAKKVSLKHNKTASQCTTLPPPRPRGRGAKPASSRAGKTPPKANKR